MKTIWIIGVGRFGSIAVKRLLKQHSNLHIVLVDPAMENLAKLKKNNITIEQTDGIKFLYNNLKPDTKVSWIVPSLPIHMAWEWCHMKIGQTHLVRAKSLPGIDSLLPNPMHGANKDIYVSNANFTCPDNCSEPKKLCTITKRPRKQEMYHRLRALRYKNYSSVVLHSRQLVPGVGGVSPKQLFAFLKEINQHKGPLLLSTACRCHGVITGVDQTS
ncbi:MAG: potassium transporter [Desulfobacula sp.]|nr:potassium transporter [Desulfobacula sp.]